MAIIIKTRQEIALLREAGRINAQALEAMRRAVRPGVTTAELDAVAREVLRAHDAAPAFLGYPNPDRRYSDHPYPATITASINDELVHGIPGHRVLQEGDIISLDCGCIYNGFVGDAAFTMGVGRISAEAERLIRVTEEALYKAIEVSRVGNYLGDVAAAIQEYAEGHGYNVVREYTGHGVGRDMHEDPIVPNWGQRGSGVKLRKGMTYAPEPMLMIGSPEVQVKQDGWTVATCDHNLCAHFEHTIALTDGEAEILTLL
ncbi:MAG: type I methionyl aminopeptidase [Chloroflexi bacterium]|nr:type I methionyl aminopeptidase [Chloroflexota bacterium]